MLMEKNAFDAGVATSADRHDATEDGSGPKSQMTALVVLGVYFLALVVATVIWGGLGTVAWALVSVPLAGIWILYLTWVVPD